MEAGDPGSARTDHGEQSVVGWERRKRERGGRDRERGERERDRQTDRQRERERKRQTDRQSRKVSVKLNRFHMHLADDEGWRLEIPGLPELTTVSSLLWCAREGRERERERV